MKSRIKSCPGFLYKQYTFLQTYQFLLRYVFKFSEKYIIREILPTVVGWLNGSGDGGVGSGGGGESDGEVVV